MVVRQRKEFAKTFYLGHVGPWHSCWVCCSVKGQLNTETSKLLTLQKVNQDILENEDMRDVSENEKSVDDPDRVGILEESASDLSDGEDEE